MGKRQRFTKEFKQEALRLWKGSGRLDPLEGDRIDGRNTYHVGEGRDIYQPCFDETVVGLLEDAAEVREDKLPFIVGSAEIEA